MVKFKQMGRNDKETTFTSIILYSLQQINNERAVYHKFILHFGINKTQVIFVYPMMDIIPNFNFFGFHFIYNGSANNLASSLK